MTDNNLPASLKARMALSAQGCGAVIAGILDVRTVTDTRNGTALNALHIIGLAVMPTCSDPDCDCCVRLLARLRPEVKIVPVSIEARMQ